CAGAGDSQFDYW
nr:immunoglobulin heavy chain junction region [Macaca mulatta]MOY25298.1 immunoglobulin heavy chain junction region [Macaca mulatta]MOY26970.1 immunoglobulin heavy chain junction region [Macaca mulatta]